MSHMSETKKCKGIILKCKVLIKQVTSIMLEVQCQICTDEARGMSGRDIAPKCVKETKGIQRPTFLFFPTFPEGFMAPAQEIPC